MRVFAVTVCAFAIASLALGQQSPNPSGKTGRSSISGHDVTFSEARPEHPITPKQVHEILELTHANQMARQLSHGMLANLQKEFPPYFPKAVLDDLQSALDRIDIESIAVPAYQRHISAEDAAQIIAFYKTLAGQRLIGAMPVITQEMQEGGARLGTEMTQQVLQKHVDEIRAAALKYRQEHADTPTITAPN